MPPKKHTRKPSSEVLTMEIEVWESLFGLMQQMHLICIDFQCFAMDSNLLLRLCYRTVESGRLTILPIWRVANARWKWQAVGSAGSMLDDYPTNHCVGQAEVVTKDGPKDLLWDDTNISLAQRERS